MRYLFYYDIIIDYFQMYYVFIFCVNFCEQKLIIIVISESMSINNQTTSSQSINLNSDNR